MDTITAERRVKELEAELSKNGTTKETTSTKAT